MYVDSHISYDKILVFTFQIGDHFYICASRFLSHLSHKDDFVVKQSFSYLFYAFCCFFTVWRIYKVYKIKKRVLCLNDYCGSALFHWASGSSILGHCGFGSVAGVLDEPYSQLIPLSGVAVQARKSSWTGIVSNFCSLEGRYGYCAELA
jgi:hypothetical protein